MNMNQHFLICILSFSLALILEAIQLVLQLSLDLIPALLTILKYTQLPRLQNLLLILKVI